MLIIQPMKFTDLIAHFKTQQKLADVIGIDQSAISQWKYAGIPIPRQYQIQVITNGKLKAERH